MPCLRFLDAPVPVNAVFEPGKVELIVTFSRELAAGPLDAANWTWTFGITQYAAVTAVAADDAVVLIGAPQGASVGDNVVNYSPPPFDVRASGAHGAAAGAFSEFPVV